MAYDIVAIGEPLIEFNQTRGGDARAYLQGFGGDTSNMAIAAARLGARVALCHAAGWRCVRSHDPGAVAGRGRGIRRCHARSGSAHRRLLRDSRQRSGHEFSYLRAGSAATRMRAEYVAARTRARRRACCTRRASARPSPRRACDAVFAAFAHARDAGALIDLRSERASQAVAARASARRSCSRRWRSARGAAEPG